MQNTLTIRYKFIHKLVNDLYISLGLNSYPIDIYKVIASLSDFKITIVTYSTFMNDFNWTFEQVVSVFRSEDSCFNYDPDTDSYIIYYNDITINNAKRIFWSITHELAHILCKHKSLNKSNFPYCSEDDFYKFQESEANYFTSIFLAHPAILKALNIHNQYEIEVFCNLSSEAAEYRYNNYKKNTSFRFLTGSDRYIIRNFKEFIDLQNEDYKFHLEFLQAFQR